MGESEVHRLYKSTKELYLRETNDVETPDLYEKLILIACEFGPYKGFSNELIMRFNRLEYSIRELSILGIELEEYFSKELSEKIRNSSEYDYY